MSDPDDELRTFANALFTDPDETPEAPAPAEPDPARNNVSPHEGGTPPPRPDDHDLREFARNLFTPEHH